MFNSMTMNDNNINSLKQNILYGALISCGLYIAYESYNFIENATSNYIENKSNEIFNTLIESDEIKSKIDDYMKDRCITLLHNLTNSEEVNVIINNYFMNLINNYLETDEFKNAIRHLLNNSLEIVNNDERVRKQIKKLLKHYINNLLVDNTTKNNIITMINSIISNKETIDTCKNIFYDLSDDDEITNEISCICNDLICSILDNEDNKQRIEQYIRTFLSDETVQNSTENVIKNSILKLMYLRS